MFERVYARRLALSLISALLCLGVSNIARAEVASIYGGSDGLCGSRTANGEHLNCAAMTAAHRTWPFGTLVRVCHMDASSCGSTIAAHLCAGGTLICRQPRHERSGYIRPGPSRLPVFDVKPSRVIGRA